MKSSPNSLLQDDIYKAAGENEAQLKLVASRSSGGKYQIVSDVALKKWLSDVVAKEVQVAVKPSGEKLHNSIEESKWTNDDLFNSDTGALRWLFVDAPTNTVAAENWVKTRLMAAETGNGTEAAAPSTALHGPSYGTMEEVEGALRDPRESSEMVES